MKSFLFVCFLLIGLSVSAQDSNVNFDKRMDKMAKTYDLTSAQYSSVKSILTTKADDMNKLNSAKVSVEEQSQKMKEIENQYESSLLSVLDDRQKKIYQIQKAIRENAVNAKIESK